MPYAHVDQLTHRHVNTYTVESLAVVYGKELGRSVILQYLIQTLYRVNQVVSCGSAPAVFKLAWVQPRSHALHDPRGDKGLRYLGQRRCIRLNLSADEFGTTFGSGTTVASLH